MFVMLLLAAAVPVPMGVNETVLGKADDFKVAGPARACLNLTSVDLMVGETAYVTYLGIHNGGMEVRGPRGSFSIRESEIYRRGGANGRPDALTSSTAAYWDHRSSEPNYALYPASDRARRLANVSGDRVTGARADLSFLRRIAVSSGQLTGCTRQFHYGWDVILGENEPEQPSSGEKK